MLKSKRWGVYFLFIGIVSFSSLSGQDFPDFFIEFIRYPESQVNHIQLPLKTDNTFVKSKASYSPVTFLTRSNIPILCADSLNAIARTLAPTVSIIQFNREIANDYLFEPRNRRWKLISYKNENLQNLKESEFLNFLIQYSKDESFQMKHTIFPFPYRVYKSVKRDSDPDNRLLMPREWESLDFMAIFPALCVFNSNSQAPNRQLFVFRNGKTAQFFNFILINKKWYLIEIEEYK
jgi:hypothetical protein